MRALVVENEKETASFMRETLPAEGFAADVRDNGDNTIIDMEDILRPLQLNCALSNPLPAAQGVLYASLEVRSSSAYATSS